MIKAEVIKRVGLSLLVSVAVSFAWLTAVRADDLPDFAKPVTAPDWIAVCKGLPNYMTAPEEFARAQKTSIGGSDNEYFYPAKLPVSAGDADRIDQLLRHARPMKGKGILMYVEAPQADYSILHCRSGRGYGVFVYAGPQAIWVVGGSGPYPLDVKSEVVRALVHILAKYDKDSPEKRPRPTAEAMLTEAAHYGASFYKVERFSKSGALSYDLLLPDGVAVWVLAKHGTLSGKREILVATNDEYSDSLTIVPGSPEETALLKMVDSAKGTVKKTSNDFAMLSILENLIRDRTSPWPWSN
jgi:hypothetical protein